MRKNSRTTGIAGYEAEPEKLFEDIVKKQEWILTGLHIK